ncbi:MAG: hypothetical protein OCU22_03890 [Canidatus Methanoxibalbensis ujae]|nr:hypothetical protein [Candidatus Methanoxibalbensis ujae]
MKILIDWFKYESKLKDLSDLVKYAKSAHLDGNTGILTIYEPDAFIIGELRRRKIKYTKVK